MPVALPAAKTTAPRNARCEAELPKLLVWRSSAGKSELGRPLTDDERGALVAHERALKRTLTPLGHGDDVNRDQEMTVRASLSAMFAGYRVMRQTGEDAMAIAEITLSRLRKFPAWAIVAACNEIIEGAPETSIHYAPNDAEIHAVVARIVRAEQQRLDTAQLLLGAAPAALLEKPATPSGPRRDALLADAIDAFWRDHPQTLARRAAMFDDLAVRKERNAAPADGQ